jgi:exopolyphosphatase / guanosine-5'-triphosphate,3'-diphosphate pyrophosphatase
LSESNATVRKSLGTQYKELKKNNDYMKLAVIDCGTNTFNLIIVQLNGKKYERVFNTRIPVKLGEGFIEKGYIGEKAFQRGIDAISQFHDELKENKVDKVLAFATSAIRDGLNGKEFVETVKDQFSIQIDVIDGDREAELIYFAIREAVKLNSETSLIMDIGGGSTEFILANDKEILWKQSFNIGAARLLQKFAPSDPISKEEIEKINTYLESKLVSLFIATEEFKPNELIGSSGAFESIIEMINGELGGQPFVNEKTEYDINLDEHFTISQKVIRSTLEERRKIRGLVPMRFDMIVICCLMVDFILRSFNLKKMRVSTYSLKEGALIDHIRRTL